MNEIDVQDLEVRRKSGAPHVLIDVREADELARAAVTGARHIPMNDIPARLDEIPNDIAVVVMCHHGGRSARVTKFLIENERPNALNLRGGIDAWSIQIDPAVPRYN